MLEAGQTINSRYLLQSSIGEGAMGAVWRAEDQTLRRQVAIKFLYGRGMRDPQAMVDQFLREARIAASVQHRNVIQTVDFGTVDQFQPFMVMELLNGESLGDRFAREPALTAEQLVHIISLTLRGLAAVHDAGIVHRDLKPQNVFLQRDEGAVYPKILDFGISRILEGGSDRSSAIATQEGLIIGTPDYMSPEQARGEGSIDKRADIYSIAVILYEGLAGRLPFEATAVGDLIVQIVTKEPPRIKEVAPQVSSALSDMVAQAMSKDREHRFADARAMRRALLSAAESSMPASRRAAASVPPAQSSAVSSAAIPAAVPWSPPNTETRGAPWGDFEGLNAQRIVDDSPPVPAAGPSFAPAQAPQQQRMVARLGDDLLGNHQAPDALVLPPIASAEAKPIRDSGADAKKRNRKAADLESPLYASNSQSIPELDYDRMRTSGARRPLAAAQPVRARPSQARTRPAAPRTNYKRNWGAWLLPLVAVGLFAYTFLTKKPKSAEYAAPHDVQRSENTAAEQPGDPNTLPPSVAGSDVMQIRLTTKARRPNPGSAPVHLRDVGF